tara:strand:+ start:849 stop:1238 length:390 start_codon:yes stop_codon:yes gene_type:complete
MREVEITLKEILVKNVIPSKDVIDLMAMISIKNTNKNIDIPLGFGLPQEMNHDFFKKLRESQETPVNTFYTTPVDFIQVIKFQNYESVEKKVLLFFRSIWHEVHHIKSHKSLTPTADKIEEIRNMRLRL